MSQNQRPDCRYLSALPWTGRARAWVSVSKKAQKNCADLPLAKIVNVRAWGQALHLTKILGIRCRIIFNLYLTRIALT